MSSACRCSHVQSFPTNRSPGPASHLYGKQRSRLSPALPGSAVLFGLVFGRMLAANWISQVTAPTTTHPEVTMDTAKSDKKPVRRLFFNTVTAAFAAPAIGLVGYATSG